MATTIITCSIPIELAQFLSDNDEISPSKVLQAALFRIRDDEARLHERIKAYETKLFRATGKLNKLFEWAENEKIVIPQNVLE